jgi:hypothetical protein
LALLLVSWQGPIPWCHSHESLHSFAKSFDSRCESSPPQTNLVTHLAIYHGERLHRTTTSLGWHFHIGYPQPAAPDSSDPNGSPQEFPTTLGGVDCGPLVAKSEAGRTEITDVRLAAWNQDSLTRGIAERPAAGRFFDHFAPNLPLPLRFGVIRC